MSKCLKCKKYFRGIGLLCTDCKKNIPDEEHNILFFKLKRSVPDAVKYKKKKKKNM